MAKEMIRIPYLTDEGLSFLKSEFDNHFIYYQSNRQEDLLNILHEKQYLIESMYEIEDFRSKLSYDKEMDSNDLHNIKVLYTAMKNIPTYVAMDDRFWAGITHTFMWEYIIKRKKKDGFDNSDPDKVRNAYYNSFFTHTKNGKKRGTYVNCVSRLWWAGHLTYADNFQDNPYELTEEICKTGFPSTLVILSSSNILSRKESIQAFLTVVKEKRKNGYMLKRQDLVRGIRHLNLIAGITVLDVMSYEEVKEILEEFYTYLDEGDVV